MRNLRIFFFFIHAKFKVSAFQPHGSRPMSPGPQGSPWGPGGISEMAGSNRAAESLYGSRTSEHYGCREVGIRHLAPLNSTGGGLCPSQLPRLHACKVSAHFVGSRNQTCAFRGSFRAVKTLRSAFIQTNKNNACGQLELTCSVLKEYAQQSQQQEQCLPIHPFLSQNNDFSTWTCSTQI